jgi:hypothetical protein
LDEVELFAVITQHNGDPKLISEHPEIGRSLDCRYITFAYQLNKVLRYLASRQKIAKVESRVAGHKLY